MAPMMLDDDDFIRTLSDDDAIPDEDIEESTAESSTQSSKSTKRKRDAPQKSSAVKKQRTGESDGGKDQSDFTADFDVDLEARAADLTDFDGLDFGGDGFDAIEKIVGSRTKKTNESRGDDASMSDAPSEQLDVEDGSEPEDAELDGEESSTEDEDEDTGLAVGAEDVEDFAAPLAHPDDEATYSPSDAEEEQDEVEKEKAAAFFAPDTIDLENPKSSKANATFGGMRLSRPIMKGLSTVGFAEPTPIQQKTIPIALEGLDIVGGAVTGSGKTAAFIIPILERLLFREKRIATTRVVILMPTRELALQCLSVAKKLAQHTDVTFGRAIGGLNQREQEKELKLRPDIVIATPGRFIDLMRNSAALQTDKIEIMVLDEADRMLEEGFSDELNEILKTIPKSRQTMLFSATMTSKIDDLVRVGLQRPVRLMVDAQKASAQGLVQEFVRLRPGRESKRIGYLMYLCTEVHRDRVIIFFRQKKEAHRVRVIFALCGLPAAELHGSMSQEQRMQAMETFKAGRARFLLATDLASRGLDIKGVETVINYEAPQSHEIYLHRVGRTARAGRKGVSCTLAAEPDRKVVKAAVKAAKLHGATIRQRTIDPKDADSWFARCEGLQPEIEEVLKEEKEDKALQATQRELTRADNIVEHREEIMARPKKTWFASEKEKIAASKQSSKALNSREANTVADAEPKKREKVKLSNKKRKKLEDRDERKAGREWKKGKGDRPNAKPVKGKGKKSVGKAGSRK